MDDQTDCSNSEQNKKWIKTISDLSLADLKPKCVPGEKIGSGSVVELIGEGGMARVFKIWNEDLEMPRAVKIMLPSGKKEVADRFVTEARLTARLNHPNIVLVFGVGEWNGYHFIEMEYIDGYPLDKLLAQRKSFPAYASCAICILIARALCYAHAQKFTLYNKEFVGIIHRDLKPANIMLHRDGRLKLMDFGIARPIKTGFHTMDDNIVGTLQYLSPEQLSNKGIDQRTDIYAVGAILYELLCGTKAFPDDEALTDLVNKKAEGIYKPFDEFSVAVPAKITTIVDTCLQVRPEDRYLNAAALLDALTHAYEQCTSEQMESALKNFLDDPHYMPALPLMDKKNVQKKSLPESMTGSVNSAATQRPAIRPVLITILVLGIVFSTVLTLMVVSKRITFGSVASVNASVSVLSNDSGSVPTDSFSTEDTANNRSTIRQIVPDQPFQSQMHSSFADSVENEVTEKAAYVDTLKTAPSTSSITDQYEIAVKVLHNGSLTDAYTEISKVESGDPRKVDLQMDLVEKCIEKGDVERARKLVYSITSDAARVHLLRGRVFYEKKEPERALNELESAMFASTGSKNARMLKCDILFYQACCYELIYKKSKLTEHRQPAIRFWKQVQKYYAATPGHPRYILATEKIQNL